MCAVESKRGAPNHWLDQPAASFGWIVEAAAAHPLRSAEILEIV